MKPSLQLGLLLVLASCAPAEVLDRIAASVNNTPILLSQVDEAARFAAFFDGRKPASITDADRGAALARVIDQELIRQQIRRTEFTGATDAEVATKINELRKQLPSGSSDAAWRSALAQFEVDESDLTEYVRNQLDELLFIDLRFRPNVHIGDTEIETYYRAEFLPKLQRAGAQEKPLSEVRAEIEEILLQQQVNRIFNVWLQGLRAEGRVRVLISFGAPRAAAEQAAVPDGSTQPK